MRRIALVLVVLLSVAGSVAHAQLYHWQRVLARECRSVAFNPLSQGRILFAGPGRETSGVFRSDDSGVTWKFYARDSMSNIHQIYCLASDTNVVLAVNDDRLWRSTNGGMDWYAVSDTIGGVDGESIAYNAANDALYYGQNFGWYVWRSTDHGATWHVTGVANRDSVALCALDVSQGLDPILIQGAEDTGLLARSSDNGSSWLVTLAGDTGTFKKAEVPKVVFSWYGRGPTNDPVAIATRWLSRSRSVVETVDGGLSWLILNSPSPYVWSLEVDQRESRLQKSLIAGTKPAHFFVGLFEVPPDTIVSSLVQETTDAGKTWHSANFPIGVAGDTANPVVHDIWVLKFDTTSKRLAAATDSGVYIADTVLDDVVAANSIEIDAGEVYPNPSSNEIRIPIATPFLKARIIDAVGRELQVPSRFENGERVFDVSELPVGSYSARIDNATRTCIRFIVRHR